MTGNYIKKRSGFIRFVFTFSSASPSSSGNFMRSETTIHHRIRENNARAPPFCLVFSAPSPLAQLLIASGGFGSLRSQCYLSFTVFGNGR
ncbi:hypothetical protein ZHAS_00020056 [Anopheles sinensis]|uniref:Uncharacterized protein n=1 Tax=Anopheles sinensis TaxID=74873 RepID=A0A084WNV2_ANOSI|nr:hypothetical protein ZHAS_00020056 [Anopheles sinensis]